MQVMGNQHESLILLKVASSYCKLMQIKTCSNFYSCWAKAIFDIHPLKYRNGFLNSIHCMILNQLV